MNFIKKLLVNPFFYFPLITILLINNWGVIALITTVGETILLMSQLALLLFGIIFILDNIIKLPPWIFIVLVLPYALWVLVSFSEYEYWVTFWLATGVLYFGIFLLCGFLSNKLNVEANFGFNFITDELKERNYNSEETEETQETEEAEEAEEAEEQSKNNKGNSKKE